MLYNSLVLLKIKENSNKLEVENKFVMLVKNKALDPYPDQGSEIHFDLLDPDP